MGNKVSQKCSFNLRDSCDLAQFLSSINMLDGFYMDTTLSISSKCFVILNNLINNIDDDIIKLMAGMEIQKDENLIQKIERLKFHCGLIRHLAVANSGLEMVSELVELNNVHHLISLTLDHVQIRFVHHLKQHRETLLKLSVHYSLDSFKSLIELCGGDHSFHDNWLNLLHLDVRYNHLRNVDDSALLLTSLTVLDISRNDLEDISFIKNIPTVKCLNASFNFIRSLPNVDRHDLQVLILGYNYLDGLDGIQSFKNLSTLNVSFNMITTKDYLQQLKEMDFLKDLIMKGNPLYYSTNYRRNVLDVVSPRVSIDFAIDGKGLTKRESAYFHKRPIIVIAPPSSSPPPVDITVPIIVTNANILTPDVVSSAPSSNPKRNIHRPRIQDPADEASNRDETDDLYTLPRERKEKKIVSTSVSGTDFSVVSVVPRLESPEYSMVHNTVAPYYVGSKSSNLFVVFSNNNRQSFINVSIQMIQHKLMAVNEFNVTVDNVDLWMLMAVCFDSLHEDADTDKIIKLVFFVSSSGADNDILKLCTRTIEFTDPLQLNMFLDQINLYLRGFSVSFDSWSTVPLNNITLNCAKCLSSLKSNKTLIRPYICLTCTGTSFVLKIIMTKSSENDLPNISPAQNPTIKQNIRTGLRKNKSSTSDLVIRAFGSKESLQKKREGTILLYSDNETCRGSSFPMAISDSNLGDSKKPMFYSQEDIVGHSTDKDDEEKEDIQLIQFNLDGAIDSGCLNLNKSIIPHEIEEDNAVYVLLKSSLKTPWIIHEQSCDVNIHMHNRKIDDRVKLYFLTKVMQGKEDLLAVFKIYLVYKSTGTSINALIVLSDLRLIMFNLLDKVSNNFEECIKLVGEFNLKSLQQIEYGLNNQWIELQFKNKPPVTFLVGDSDSVKIIGSTIADASSGMYSNITVMFSKAMSAAIHYQLLSLLIAELNDELTIETLSNTESYLIKNWTALPTIEKSPLEYAPKMIVIQAEHIFLVTLGYTSKSNQPIFQLSRTISLYSLMNELVIDSFDDCTLRLIICENQEKSSVDLLFISTHSRSKAAICIGRMWKELFKMEIIYTLEDLMPDK